MRNARYGIDDPASPAPRRDAQRETRRRGSWDASAACALYCSTSDPETTPTAFVFTRARARARACNLTLSAWRMRVQCLRPDNSCVQQIRLLCNCILVQSAKIKSTNRQSDEFCRNLTEQLSPLNADTRENLHLLSSLSYLLNFQLHNFPFNFP